MGSSLMGSSGPSRGGCRKVQSLQLELSGQLISFYYREAARANN